MAIEKGEKLMKIDMCFKLPKDFNGNLNDAIQAMLDYRKGEKNHDKNFISDPKDDVYTNWWNMVCETDRPLYSAVSLSEFDGENWKDMDI